jgi:hypothetical protein
LNHWGLKRIKNRCTLPSGEITAQQKQAKINVPESQQNMMKYTLFEKVEVVVQELSKYFDQLGPWDIQC